MPNGRIRVPEAIVECRLICTIPILTDMNVSFGIHIMALKFSFVIYKNTAFECYIYIPLIVYTASPLELEEVAVFPINTHE